MQLSDSLLTLFSGKVSRSDGKLMVEVPEREVELGEVEPGDTYRIALLAQTDSQVGSQDTSTSSTQGRDRHGDTAAETDGHPTPPVEKGETRRVEVETTGDQGDGIAKVERGFVVIVPGSEPGDDVRVEIEKVQENFAIGSPIEA